MGNKSYSKGISWFDDCRIPFVYNDEPKGGFGGARIGYGNEYDGECGKANSQGRFPANILVSDDMLNDGSIVKGGTGKKYPPQYEDKLHGLGVRKTLQVSSFNDKGTNSRYYDIDKWFDKILND